MRAIRMAGVVAAVLMLGALPAAAQTQGGPARRGGVDVPGPADLDQLPTETDNNTKIPDSVDNGPAPQQGDLPPLANFTGDDIPRPTPGVVMPGDDVPLTVPDLPPPRNEAERQEREELMRRMYGSEDLAQKEERERALEDAYKATPPDAFLKAREQMRQMQQEEAPPSEVPPTPQSWLDRSRNWLASA